MLENIETQILDDESLKICFQNKSPLYLLSSALYSGKIRICYTNKMHNYITNPNPNPNPYKIIINIVGVWCDYFNYGLTYKVYIT